MTTYFGGEPMTVQSDLKKALASAESAMGTYAMFAESTEDPQAKQMFNTLKSDAERHVTMLNSRINQLGMQQSQNQQNQQTMRKQQ